MGSRPLGEVASRCLVCAQGSGPPTREGCRTRSWCHLQTLPRVLVSSKGRPPGVTLGARVGGAEPNGEEPGDSSSLPPAHDPLVPRDEGPLPSQESPRRRDPAPALVSGWGAGAGACVPVGEGTVPVQSGNKEQISMHGLHR